MITNPLADDTAPVTNPHLAALDRSFAALPSDTQDVVARAHQILGLQPPQTAGAVESAAAPAPVAPSVPNAQESASQTGPRITNPTLNPFRSAGMVAGNSDQAGALLASDRPPVSLPVQGSVGDGGDIADPGDDLPSSPSPLRIPSTNMSPAQGPTPAAQKLATLESSPSGLTGAVNGIHNPVLRGLGRVGATVADVIGSGIFPRFGAFVPGTTAHHNLLVNQAQVPVRNEQAAAKNEADVARTAAETEHTNAESSDLVPATAAHLNAETNNLSHPQPKEELEGKTLTTDQGIFQWNPTTKRYDIKAGDAPEKADKQQGTVHQLDDGSLIVAHPDGTATPVTIGGKPVKGQAKEKPAGSPEQQFLDEYKTNHPGSSVADAEKAFKQLTPKEAADRGQNFIDPATHKLVRVEPGGAVPEGALTASGVNQQNAGTDKKTQAAKDAADQANDDYSLMQQFAQHPSPTNDLAMVMHFIGATKPESLGKLRLNTNEMKLVFGTRSTLGDVEALGQKLANGQSLTPQQRQGMIDTMKLIASGTHSRAGGSSGARDPVQLDSKDPKKAADQYADLPAGTHFTTPDGKAGVKK